MASMFSLSLTVLVCLIFISLQNLLPTTARISRTVSSSFAVTSVSATFTSHSDAERDRCRYAFGYSSTTDHLEFEPVVEIEDNLEFSRCAELLGISKNAGNHQYPYMATLVTIVICVGCLYSIVMYGDLVLGTTGAIGRDLDD
jgi:hypothetical protein